MGSMQFLARLRAFVAWLVSCYTWSNLILSEPASLKRVYGLLVEIAGMPGIEGVAGNAHTPHLWKGEPDGLSRRSPVGNVGFMFLGAMGED